MTVSTLLSDCAMLRAVGGEEPVGRHAREKLLPAPPPTVPCPAVAQILRVGHGAAGTAESGSEEDSEALLGQQRVTVRL